MMAVTDRARLDKWLWHARFFKTRSLASDMVAKGKVRINARLVRKPAASVSVGDALTIAQGRRIRLVRVVAIPLRRGSATDAQACYESLPGDDDPREGAPDHRKH